MSRTRAQIRARTARQLGLDIYVTGTADTGGSTTTLKDAPLSLYKDDYFNGAFILLTSGSPTFTILEVTDFVQSTGVLTFRPTLGAAPDTLAYEILPYHPTHLYERIQDALDSLFERELLSQEYWIRGVVSGSPAYNAGFDYWPDTTIDPEGYTSTGGIPLRETTNITLSEQCVNFNNATNLKVSSAAYTHFFDDLRGRTAKFYSWAFSGSANAARLNLDVDGTANYSSYVTAGLWDLLSVEVNVAATADRITPNFTGTVASVRYSDWWVEGIPGVVEHPIPAALIPRGINEILISSSLGGTGTPYPRRHQWMRATDMKYTLNQSDRETALLTFLAGQPAPGRRLAISTTRPITLPSNDTTTVNLSVTEELLVAKIAATMVLEGVLVRAPLSLHSKINARLALLRQQIVQLEESSDSAAGWAPLPLHLM